MAKVKCMLVAPYSKEIDLSKAATSVINGEPVLGTITSGKYVSGADTTNNVKCWKKPKYALSSHRSSIATTNLFTPTGGLQSYFEDLLAKRGTIWVLEARLNLKQEHCLKTTGCLDLNDATKVTGAGSYDWKTLAEYLG